MLRFGKLWGILNWEKTAVLGFIKYTKKVVSIL